MDLVKTFIGGIVVIGIITAVGLHAAGLAQVGGSAGSAGQGLLHTSEKG